MTVIHQVTDIHIPVSGDMTVRQNFRQIMAYVAERAPDLLVISGDLPGEDGSREVYEWIKSELPADIPCLILPGNHDNPELLFEIFQSDLNRDPSFFEKMQLDDIDVLFANTATDVLPEAQIVAIQDSAVREGSVLFLHHPTEVVSAGFMDKVHALKNRDATGNAIRSSNVKHVFCGHFHTEGMVSNGYDLYVTPSPAFEVGGTITDPAFLPPRLPLREIVIDGRSLETRVIYLDE